MGTVPTDFDWINARANCSPSQAFAELRLGVEDDIKKINKLRGGSPEKDFHLARNGDGNTFEVWRGESAKSSIRFRRTDDRVEVFDSNGTPIAAYTVSFSVEGRCVLIGSDGQVEQWQARRAALEGLFFNS
jgi:hypothetical protein